MVYKHNIYKHRIFLEMRAAHFSFAPFLFGLQNVLKHILQFWNVIDLFDVRVFKPRG
jgi:hypothetical protein